MNTILSRRLCRIMARPSQIPAREVSVEETTQALLRKERLAPPATFLKMSTTTSDFHLPPRRVPFPPLEFLTPDPPLVLSFLPERKLLLLF
jgi:hypothetical protein